MASSRNLNTGSPGEMINSYMTEYVVLDNDRYVLKLSFEDNYANWKLQMRHFIRSQGLIGFIDGTPPSDDADPTSYKHDVVTWKRSDDLVRGWILATLNEETRLQLVDIQIPTARDLWLELEKIFDATRSSRKVGEKCPYSTELVHLDDVPKLSSEDNYKNWKSSMRDFIRSQGLIGFIDGTVATEESIQHDHMAWSAWKRFDDLVRGWILATLNEETRLQMLDRQIPTARDLWSELEKLFDEPRSSWEIGEKDLYSTEFVLLNTVPKLSFEDNYANWKLQMRHFIRRQGLIGFIDGTTVEESNQQDRMAWERSDNLVRGWILATLNEETRLRMLDKQEQTARDLWSELEERFDTTRPTLDFDRDLQPYEISVFVELHKAAVNGDWDKAKEILENDRNATDPVPYAVNMLRYAVTSRSTAARVRARKNRFMKELLERLTPEDVDNGSMDDSGWTTLHWAAASNDVEGAKMLVSKNPDLPHVLDEDQLTPLHLAADNGDTEMVLYLKGVTRTNFVLERDEVAASLLCHLTRGEFYDMALDLLQQKPKLACMKPNPFSIIGRKRSSFRSGSSSELNFWRFVLPRKSEGNVANLPRGGREDIENPAAANCCISGLAITILVRRHCKSSNGAKVAFSDLGSGGKIWTVLHSQEEDDFTVPSLKRIREERDKQHEALQLVNFLCMEVAKSDYSTVEPIFKKAMLVATRVGIPEIIEEILLSYPPAFGFVKLDNRDVIQYAIMHRHERLFNLIYQIDGGCVSLNALDDSENNGLHLTARLGHKQEINLKASAAGPVLQIQRELQWYEEVKKLSAPSAKDHRNKDGMTPREVFTETHQDLVSKAERWMKDTATSCTIVAALVATVVFAASITAPGGNDTLGYPLLLKRKAFEIFGMSNALALFSSITSVLMFLLILTSRYREQDFLHTLPTRLIIGLVTLFVSILSTMVTFGATLYLMFGDSKAWILIPTIALASVPVILFGALQFPLLVEMIQATYGKSIFGQQSDRMIG